MVYNTYMTKIKHIIAREILASGGAPSLEVEVILESGVKGEASVSYGASFGSKEAVVLLDEDKSRYHGKGMLKAVQNVNEKLAPLLMDKDASDQRGIDKIMINADGTENKANFGANAILGVSMAVARAAAADSGLELYQSLATTYNLQLTTSPLPKPMMVMIEGGKHADNSTDMQEYMLSALRDDLPAKENIRMVLETYEALKKILKDIGLNTNVGNEGAFAPNGLASNERPLEFLVEAIEKAGFKPGLDIGISLDPAASEFYREGMYQLATEKRALDSHKLIEVYLQWMAKYPIVTLEDGLSEFDWNNWPHLMAKAVKTKIIADDLTVTNTKLWQKAIDMKAANAILIKLNQAGTVTETMDCCLLAKKHNLSTIPSHRGGGETNDTFLVDLAVAVGSEWIKVGPTRGERVCKYNRLMRIEEKLKI